MLNSNSNSYQNAEEGYEPILDYYDLGKACSVYRALNHKLRQKILSVIESHKRINVKKIYEELRLDQAVLSQHLAILRKTNVVNVDSKGKNRYYSVNHRRLAEISDLSSDLVNG